MDTKFEAEPLSKADYLREQGQQTLAKSKPKAVAVAEDAIFGYRCPTCKTINSKSATYCMNCGQWLLDTNYPAEPLKQNEYIEQVRAFAKSRGNVFSGKTKKDGAIIKIIGQMVAFFTLALLIVLAIIPGSVPREVKSVNSAIPKTNNSPILPPPQPQKADLEILDTGSQVEGSVQYAVGSIKNNSYRQHNSIQAEISFYDGKGTLVGSTTTNTNNLVPGGLWKFKVPVISKNVTSFRVKASGY